jgi:hypothetical protein
MFKSRWFGWGLHLRQERATYGTLLAVVAAFGTALIVLGGLQVHGTQSNVWGNPLVDLGIVVVVIAAIGTLFIALIPLVIRPKLSFGGLFKMNYGMDQKLAQAALGGGGLAEAYLVGVEVIETGGVRSLDTEVWITDVNPRPTPIVLPKQLEASDSRSTYGDVPANGRLNFILWISGTTVNGGPVGYSRTGWFGTETCTISLEIRREGRLHETKQFSVPGDISQGILLP